MMFHRQLLLRRTLRNLGLATLPILIAGICVTGVSFFPGIDRDVYLDLVSRCPVKWGHGIVCSALFFTALQINHPMISKDLAKWCMAASWDGRRTLTGVPIRLSSIECAAVAMLVLAETLLAGSISVFSAGAWLLIRMSAFSSSLHRNGESLSCACCVIATVSCILLIDWPVALLIVLIVTAATLESAKNRASIVWAAKASHIDPEQLPSLKPQNVTQTKKLFPWSDLDPSVEDPRPAAATAVVVAGLLGYWTFVATLKVIWIAESNGIRATAIHLAKVDYIFDGDLIAINTVMAWTIGLGLPVAVALVGLLVRRISWFNCLSWKSSPGLLARWAQRRPIVWSYDRCLPNVFLPVVITVATLAMNLWLPLQFALTAGIGAYSLMRMGPDPAVWHLTADASLKNVYAAHNAMEERRRSRNR